MQRTSRAPRRSFSLVELLVVLGTLGLLVGLLLPAVQAVRAAADRMACLSRLKQLGLALHHYHDTQGRLPAPPLRASSSDPSLLLNWMALILPHLEQEALWSASVQA